jgi:hypothetical protein
VNKPGIVARTGVGSLMGAELEARREVDHEGWTGESYSYSVQRYSYTYSKAARRFVGKKPETEYEYRDAEYEYDPTAQIAPNRRGNISLTRTL